jgi:hypothetical protein
MVLLLMSIHSFFSLAGACHHLSPLLRRPRYNNDVGLGILHREGSPSQARAQHNKMRWRDMRPT